MTKNQKIVLLLLLGLSGIISGLLALFVPTPGIAFGVVMGSWFFVVERSKGIRAFIWFIISTLSYILAYMIFIKLSGGPFGDEAMLLPSFLLAGAIGSLGLITGTCIFIRKISLINNMIILCIGSGLGILFKTGDNLIFPFMAWQVSVGMALAIFVNKNKIPVVSEAPTSVNVSSIN